MKIALIGYGKMGIAIEELALQQGHQISLKINSKNNHDLTPEKLLQTDVAIEFTNPHSAVDNILKCIETGIPVVCGSTGWLGRLSEIEDACRKKNGAFLYASNFSIGVNIFFEINKKLASLMHSHEEYNISIEETHHTQKKDAPSGTAISLAQQVLEQIEWKKNWVNQLNDNNEDLQIISKRIDPASGTHKVTYSSAIDTIDIIHTAHNRQGFAAGAIAAAEFLKDKKGIFTMKDVLGI